MLDSVMASFNLRILLFTDDVQSMYIQTFVQNFVLILKHQLKPDWT